MKTKDREFVLIAIGQNDRFKFLEPLNDAIIKNADDEEEFDSDILGEDNESSIRMSIADDHMDVRPIRPSKDAVSSASYRESVALSKAEDNKSELSDMSKSLDSPKSRHSETGSLKSATASVKSGTALSGSKKSEPGSVARSRPSKQISNRYSN